MTSTATRVAAAVGATVVMLGLATPALACTNTDGGGGPVVVNSAQAKNDPGKAFDNAKHAPLTLAERQAKLDAKIAEKLAWLDAVTTKVTASSRLSDAQKSAVLARVQSSVAALTQLRADVAAATTLDGLRAVLKAADVNLFHRWNDGRHHGSRHHDGNAIDQRHAGGDRHAGGARHAGGDQRHAGVDRHSGSNHGGGFQH